MLFPLAKLVVWISLYLNLRCRRQVREQEKHKLLFQRGLQTKRPPGNRAAFSSRENSSNGGKAIRTFWRHTMSHAEECQGNFRTKITHLIAAIYWINSLNQRIAPLSLYFRHLAGKPFQAAHSKRVIHIMHCSRFNTRPDCCTVAEFESAMTHNGSSIA
jgi:hypothetical protein